MSKSRFHAALLSFISLSWWNPQDMHGTIMPRKSTFDGFCPQDDYEADDEDYLEPESEEDTNENVPPQPRKTTTLYRQHLSSGAHKTIKNKDINRALHNAHLQERRAQILEAWVEEHAE